MRYINLRFTYLHQTSTLLWDLIFHSPTALESHVTATRNAPYDLGWSPWQNMAQRSWRPLLWRSSWWTLLSTGACQTAQAEAMARLPRWSSPTELPSAVELRSPGWRQSASSEPTCDCTVALPSQNGSTQGNTVNRRVKFRNSFIPYLVLYLGSLCLGFYY